MTVVDIETSPAPPLPPPHRHTLTAADAPFSARMVFLDDIAAPEDVAWWLRDTLRPYDHDWAVQVEISAGGLVAAAAREHTGGGECRVVVSEHPLRALVEVECARRPGETAGRVAWAVVA
jgi:hypothetical protein